MSEKKDISNTYNSIFDQNTVTELEDVIEGKEYQQAIFGQDMNGAINEVLYTRTQYIKDYSEIDEYYQREKKEQIKCIGMVCVIYAVVTAVSLFVENFMYAHPMMLNTVINGLLTAVKVFSGPICLFIILGFLKKLRQLKKHRQTAIEKLDNLKNEHITNATYDAKR